MTVPSANYLLRVLHGRRVAGTLDDPAFNIHTAQYSEEQISTALQYLRSNVKVDEVLNAGLRAEDELKQLELEEERNSKTEEAPKEEEEDDKSSLIYKPDPVYGRSSFDEIRARNEAKDRARQRALEEERKAAEAEGRIETLDDPSARSLVEVEEGQRAITNPKIAEYYKNASSGIDEVPEMSRWERLGPSAVAFVLMVGFLASLTMVYKEPSRRYRLFPEVSTATATLAAIVGINVIAFAGWKFPPFWRFFNKYMIVVVGMPRPITLLTANFSHQSFKHLVLNMIPLAFAGVYIHEDLGRMGFLTLYLTCGAFGFLSGLVLYTARGMVTVTSMGSSGATMGLMTAYFWDHRNDRFKIFGLPEDGTHGVVWWALLLGYQLYEMTSTFAVDNKIDVVGHASGLVMGMVGIELMNWAGLGRKKTEERKEMSVTEDKIIVKDLVSGGELQKKQ